MSIRRLTPKGHVDCPNCQDTGKEPAAESVETCSRCKGCGKVPPVCNYCNGEGTVPELVGWHTANSKCPDCGGDGKGSLE